MPYLYLIRHPLTQPDPHVPASKWDLSAEGRAQVDVLRAAAFWKTVRAVYTSDQYKAAVVGEVVATAYNIPHHVRPALTEADRDRWLEADEFRAAQQRFFAQPAAEPVPGWESAQAAGARFRDAMAQVLDAHAPDESLAVVAHATVFTLYVAHLRAEAASWELWKTLGFAAVMAVDRATLQPVTPFITAPYTDVPV